MFYPFILDQCKGHRPAALALLISALLTAVSLSGCATPADGPAAIETSSVVDADFKKLNHDMPSAQGSQAVQQLLRQALTADSAAQFAVLAHPGLQAAQAQWQLSQLQAERAGRLPNPSISLGRMSGGGHVEIDRALRFDLLGLFSLPLMRQLAQQELAQAETALALQTAQVATQAKLAFFDAVAARQLAAYAAQVQDAALASAELTRRMVAAGNWPAVAQEREAVFQAEAANWVARARQNQLVAEEGLRTALGLGSVQLPASWLENLPQRLPDLPAQAPEASLPAAEEQAAIDARLDLRLARQQALALAKVLDLQRSTGWVNVLHLGWQDQRSNSDARLRGFEVELEMPLFDGGSGRTAQAQLRYQAALHSLAAQAQAARSEVRLAWSDWAVSDAAARRYRDEIVPARQRISEEMLLRYNGMLISVFDLLADAREQIQAVSAAVAAQRDAWQAYTRLQLAMSTGGTTSTSRSAGVRTGQGSNQAAPGAGHGAQH